MIQAAFFDLDGTLLSFKTHCIPESARQSLDKLREQGVLLFAATGRHLTQLEPVHKQYRFDGYITLNGQYCYNDQQVIYKHAISKEDVAAAVKQAQAHNFPCYFTEEHHRFINVTNEQIEAVCKQTDTPLPAVDNPDRALHSDIYQLVVYLDREHEHLLLDYTPGVDVTRWHNLFMDVVPKGGSKAVGIQKVLEHYQIPQANTIAFGDAENDMEMIRFAGIGVAMGNACQELKQIADYVTDSVEQDGIQHALVHFRLI